MVFEEEEREVVLGSLFCVGVGVAFASLSLLATRRGELRTECRTGGPRNGDSSSDESAPTGVIRPCLVTDCGDDGAELADSRGSCGDVGVPRVLVVRE